VPDSHQERPGERILERWRGILGAAGTLVIASAVVVTPGASAAVAPGSVIERVEAARAQLALERLLRDAGEANHTRLTWHTWHDWRDYKDHDQSWNNVGSWHNVGYQSDRWQNWQNWHDWKNNEGDWGNRY